MYSRRPNPHLSQCLRLTTTGLLLATVVACGGGGGGSGDDSNNDNDGNTQTRTPFFTHEGGFELANDIASPITQMLQSLQGLQSATTGSNASSNRNPLLRATQSDTETCSNGGTADYIATLNDGSFALESVIVDFNDCDYGEGLTNGAFSVSSSSDLLSGSGTALVTYGNLTTAYNGGSSALNGSLNTTYTYNGDVQDMVVSGTRLSQRVDGESSAEFSDYSFTTNGNNDTGDFTLEGTGEVTIGERAFDVTISPPLTGNQETGFATGRVTMLATDGSSVIIDADTGNPDTFNYTIFDGSTTTSGEGNWADTDLAI